MLTRCSLNMAGACAFIRLMLWSQFLSLLCFQTGNMNRCVLTWLSSVAVRILLWWQHLEPVLLQGSAIIKPFRNMAVQWPLRTWFQKLERLLTSSLKPDPAYCEQLTALFIGLTLECTKETCSCAVAAWKTCNTVFPFSCGEGVTENTFKDSRFLFNPLPKRALTCRAEDEVHAHNKGDRVFLVEHYSL